MKKLNLLLLKAFIGPFIATLFITNFLLLMIWFWKWLEDIVGKGLEISLILELVGYASLNQIPMSLPLAMLLSSIMTFGKLGETVELTALKALGVSMLRIMRPLIFITILFTFAAFYINDSVLPKTNTKLKNLLQDITSKKPELSIPEGVFYKGLEGYTIRVGKKNEDKSLKDILIFDNKSNADRFILADSGKILVANNGNTLVLHLFNGNAYEYQKEDFENNKERWYDYTVMRQVEMIANNQLALIIDCGIDDFFMPVNRALHEKLLQLKIDHDYIERPGEHNHIYWGNSIDYQILFFEKFFQKNK